MDEAEMEETGSDGAGSGEAGVPRLLAIDVGERRIGVAISDPMGWTVQPLLTFERRTPHLDAKSVARLVRRHGVAELVVGHPLRLSGERSEQTKRVEVFAEQLRGYVAVPLHLFDERLSTAEAHERMDQTRGAVRGRKANVDRRREIDQAAAVVILEDFLADRAHKEAIRRRRAAMEEGGVGNGEAGDEGDGRL